MEITQGNLRYVIELYGVLQRRVFHTALPLPSRTQYPEWTLEPGKAEAVVTFAFQSVWGLTDDWMTIRALVWFHPDGSLNKIVTIGIGIKSLLPTPDARMLVHRMGRVGAETIHRQRGRRYILNEEKIAKLPV